MDSTEIPNVRMQNHKKTKFSPLFFAFFFPLIFGFCSVRLPCVIFSYLHIFTKSKRTSCVSLDHCRRRNGGRCWRCCCTVWLLLYAERLIERWCIALREIQFMFDDRSHARYQIRLFVHCHLKWGFGAVDGHCVQATGFRRMRVHMIIDVFLYFRFGGKSTSTIRHWTAKWTVTLE